MIWFCHTCVCLSVTFVNPLRELIQFLYKLSLFCSLSISVKWQWTIHDFENSRCFLCVTKKYFNSPWRRGDWSFPDFQVLYEASIYLLSSQLEKPALSLWFPCSPGQRLVPPVELQPHLQDLSLLRRPLCS